MTKGEHGVEARTAANFSATVTNMKFKMLSGLLKSGHRPATVAIQQRRPRGLRGRRRLQISHGSGEGAVAAEDDALVVRSRLEGLAAQPASTSKTSMSIS
jgi:hypothetical protein